MSKNYENLRCKQIEIKLSLQNWMILDIFSFNLPIFVLWIAKSEFYWE